MQASLLSPNRPEAVPNDDVLCPDLLREVDAYWCAANYLYLGQIYLYDNALLREPLTLAHVKPLVVRHWGTTPGQNFAYVHLNQATNLAQNVLERLPESSALGTDLKQMMQDKLIEHKQYMDEHGQDLTEVRNWKWGGLRVGQR